MVDLTSLVSLAAGFSGVLASATTLIAVVRTHKRQREDLRRLAVEAQDRAIGSSSMELLGTYLLNDIGEVRISDVCV